MLFLTYIETSKLLFSLGDAFRCIQIVSVWIYAENSNINGFCLFIVLTNSNAWSRFIHVLLFIHFYYCLLVFFVFFFFGLIFRSFFFTACDLVILFDCAWSFPYIFHRSEKHKLYSLGSNEWHIMTLYRANMLSQAKVKNSLKRKLILANIVGEKQQQSSSTFQDMHFKAKRDKNMYTD